MYLHTCTNNEHGLLTILRDECGEVQRKSAPIVSTVLKVFECATVAFGIGWTIYQRVVYGLDSKLIAGLLCGSCIWGIGKYNQASINEKIARLEQFLYVNTEVVLGSVCVQKKAPLCRTDSESSGVSSGDVDSPLPMSTEESEW